MKRALFIGCGRDRTRKVRFQEEAETYSGDWEIESIDIDPFCNPTKRFDMNNLYYLKTLVDRLKYWPNGLPITGESLRISDDMKFPFNGSIFDDIHAYDSLEHWGQLGDWKGWFDEMSVYHQLLRPGGAFRVLVPIGEDALADPGHCRFFHENHFAFLTKDFYERNGDKPITDYRWYIKHWWEIKIMQRVQNHHLAVIMVPV